MDCHHVEKKHYVDLGQLSSKESSTIFAICVVRADSSQVMCRDDRFGGGIYIAHYITYHKDVKAKNSYINSS